MFVDRYGQSRNVHKGPPPVGRPHSQHNRLKQPMDCDMSFSAFEPKDHVAEDFSDEMMAWYDDSGTKKPSYV